MSSLDGTAQASSRLDGPSLRALIAALARDEGLDTWGVAQPRLPPENHAALCEWLANGYHGNMDYMTREPGRRVDPSTLMPSTLRVLVFAADYELDQETSRRVLGDSRRGYVARYALGRDYHHALRGRLKRLARRLNRDLGSAYHFRALVDSAPLMEKPYAVQAGLGWIGKNTCLIDPVRGSARLLGELLTDLPLPVDTPSLEDRCGHCRACLQVCPTGAIVAPYRLDARRCISYLTIEHEGAIPEELRPLIGNRIFGCDDCQLVCPWNRRAVRHPLPDFTPRHGLDAPLLSALLSWDEATYCARTEGSALRRVGHERWLRNVATALGNGPRTDEAVAALLAREHHPSSLVREHVQWALNRLSTGGMSTPRDPVPPLRKHHRIPTI